MLYCLAPGSVRARKNEAPLHDLLSPRSRWVDLHIYVRATHCMSCAAVARPNCAATDTSPLCLLLPCHGTPCRRAGQPKFSKRLGIGRLRCPCTRPQSAEPCGKHLPRFSTGKTDQKQCSLYCCRCSRSSRTTFSYSSMFKLGFHFEWG